MREFLNVVYTRITWGMSKEERAEVDMILDGRTQKDIAAAQNVRALKGLGMVGQVR